MTDPFAPIELARDVARATVHPYGAHVASWAPRPGDERLFLSARAAFREGAAIRGGVPVVFPQFSDTGPLPKHGFARTRPWELVERADDSVTLRLHDDDTTRARWPHAFRAELTVALHDDALAIALGVENIGGDVAEFTAALHTYLRVADVRDASVEGLDGVRFRDSAAGGVERLQAGPVRFDGEVDRVYVDAPNVLALREPGRSLRIGADGFTDAVVWNPGAAKGDALADLEPGGWRRFVCVEAASVARPVRLEPGERWIGAQRLTVS